ncbi:MAG: indolepyruvate oxidoreductase subunit beta, partial [Candidatus Heimdallarchaeota archaeon]|nr:indolepyruvate oxidoreductase subunit beta [Candidatus Heimdallarchaeota archaeon]
MVDIIIVGVGGQGMISIGHLIAKACLELDIKFVSAETHGMSQRGGSVIFHFRIGDKTAPIVTKGQADVIISGEPMETLRYIDYLKPNGLVITNNRVINSPVNLQLGIEYPELDKLFDSIEEWPSKLFVIDAQRYAFELGMPQSENVILLGALLALGNLPITIEKMEEVITNRWPRVAETNI